MTKHGRLSRLLVILSVLPWLPACRCADPVAARLEATIADVEKIVTDSDWGQKRYQQLLMGLRKLRGTRVSGPVVLYATRLKVSPSEVALLDYVDVEPKADYVSVYVGNEKVTDLKVSAEARAAEKRYVGVLYTFKFFFESSSLPVFWKEKVVFVEIHNTTGEVSPRFPMGEIVKEEWTTTAPQ